MMVSTKEKEIKHLKASAATTFSSNNEGAHKPNGSGGLLISDEKLFDYCLFLEA